MSKYFTIILFSIAISSAVYWKFHDPSKIWNAVTAILIVACPCALLLSATFTNGNMLRVLQKFGFYARNASVIEQIAEANEIVFDKTGTITEQKKSNITYNGKPLSVDSIQLIRSLASQSSHPLSRAITQALPKIKTLKIKEYEEVKGLGIKCIAENKKIMIGSAGFVNLWPPDDDLSSKAYLKVDGEILGYFSIRTHYRKGITGLLSRLRNKYQISLLSGDNSAELNYLKPYFNSELLFSQLPQDKLNYIKKLQDKGSKIIMVGDGLNDAGALQQSNTGIAVTDSLNNFSPACDVILDGKSFPKLDLFLNYCKKNKFIINISFVVSILYNVAGLYFAVQGQLQPVIAAILMPASSISIVLLTTGLSSLFAIQIKRSSQLKTESKKKLI